MQFANRSMPALLLAVAAIALAPPSPAMSPAAPAAETPARARVLHHEALAGLVVDGAGRPRSFEAYGRRFELDLERNDRLAFVTPGRLPGVEAMRGELRGKPGSWVRLTRTPAGLYGMFSDGRDAYAIEPAHALAETAVEPLAASGSAPVVYRLADLLMPVGGATCGTVTLADLARGGTTAQQQLEAVMGDLQAATAAATLPSRQMEVAVVGDHEFSQLGFSGGLTPEQAIAARMNVVDGIFSAQIDLKILVTSVTVFGDPADPFSSTTTPNSLLDELGLWRQATPEQAARGLTHLMTGRDLDGTTVGVAYIGAPCRARFGASLSQALSLSSTTAALVVAHEMGHNVGARHDGEADSGCETTPLTFLMAARLNGSDQFSSCSLDAIRPVVAAASCVVPLSVPDATPELPVPAARLRGASFDYGFTVRSIGARQVDGVSARVALPAALALNAASVAGSSCTIAAGTATCAVGSLAPQASRAITLNLTGQQVGTATATVTLTADNDAIAGNDSGSAAFAIEPSADLAVTLSAAPTSLNVGATAELTATVRHLSGEPASDARLRIQLPAGLAVTEVGSNALGCSLQAGTVSCTPVAIATGSTAAVTLRLRAEQPGTQPLSGNISATPGDPVPADNDARLDFTVLSAGGVASAAGAASGGGGRLAAPELGGLAVLVLLATLAARRARPVRGGRAARVRSAVDRAIARH
jgi:hypothetical protein